MKTLTRALLVCLLLWRPSAAEATIALNSFNTMRSTLGAEITNGASQNTGGATLLTAVCGVYVALGATFPTITDTLGNAWHYGTGKNGLSYGARIAYAYDHGGTALSTGADLFNTTNNGNASYPACVVKSWTGTDATSAVFVTQSPGGGQTTSSSPTLAPGAITPAVGDLLLTGHAQNTDTATTASGFSATLEIGPSASNSVYSGDAHLVVVSAVSTNPTWTSPTTGEQDVVMVEFLAGTGGGGGSIPHGLTTHGIGN